jgi:hypothetical protein
MCGPVAPLLMAGASVASAGLGIMGAMNQQNADARAVAQNNDNVLLNAQSAGISASNQYSDIGRQFTYDARSAQQEANQAVMAGRSAEGTAVASAGSSGFQGNSLTVGAVMSDIDRQNADAENNYALKMDDLKSAYNSKGRTIQANAQDRINSMQFQAQPSGSALGLNIANSVVKGISGVAGAFR